MNVYELLQMLYPDDTEIVLSGAASAYYEPTSTRVNVLIVGNAVVPVKDIPSLLRRVAESYEFVLENRKDLNPNLSDNDNDLTDHVFTHRLN